MSSHAAEKAISVDEEHAPTRLPAKAWKGVKFVFWTLINHLKRTGVGLVCAVGYFDPGNWGVDLQAGSQYGYKLLFIVLLSGIFATFLQILASRLGIVTGHDLATHCRLLWHDRPKHTMWWRWGIFYPLYALSEAAIIATDLAELIGSATALCLLFPTLPLWAGVLITASDVLALLAIRDPLGHKPVRYFEALIAGMSFTVLICMAIVISRVGVNWGDAFFGYVPSKTIVASGALYTSIGIIGATVMPHGIFLGSHLATQDRIGFTRSDSSLSGDTVVPEDPTWTDKVFGPLIKNCREAFKIIPVSAYAHVAKNHAEHENPPYQFVHAHIYHGMIDLGVNLLGLAVIVNSMIVILASAVFYYGIGRNSGGPASLFDAFDLIHEFLGKAPAILFALALLCSGQASSIIDTMAGQTVAEGFLQWRLSPVMRRLITRCFGLIPSMIVAVAVGKSGVDAMLVASQVVLSIVLPFIVFPLLLLTSRKDVMTVKVQKIPKDDASDVEVKTTGSKASVAGPADLVPECAGEAEAGDDGQVDVEAAEETVCYANSVPVQIIGWILWIIVVAANVYAIVSLGMGTATA